MEDETKVLSDDDQGSSDQDKALTTQPMLKDILERVNAGFAEVNERISAGFAEVNQRLDSIDRQLRVTDNRLADFADGISRLSGLTRDHEKRLKDMEDRKAS